MALQSAAAPRLTTAVVLCAYNGADYLQAQLDSLYAQTWRPDWVVLSDDASTDATPALLTAAAQVFESMGVRVQLRCNTENLGYVRHFEQALSGVDADVLFPCDQDDVWHADKIETMAARFEADPALMLLHCDAELIDAAGAPLGKRLLEVLEMTPEEWRNMTSGDAFDVLIRRNIVTGAAMAFRRSVLAQTQPFPAEWAHDEWIAVIAALEGRVRTLNSAHLGYRQHDNNQIGVRARGVLHKVAGIAGYRKAFLARMEARYRVLAERVRNMPDLPQARRTQIDARLLHATRRNHAARALFSRAPDVVRELVSGRYHRFGRGFRSALVDLLGVD